MRRGLDDLSKLGGTDANPKRGLSTELSYISLGATMRPLPVSTKCLNCTQERSRLGGGKVLRCSRWIGSKSPWFVSIELLRWTRMISLRGRGQASNLESLGRPDDSLRCYHRALELSPDNGQIWYGQGRVLYRLGRLDDAMRSYDNGIERQPTYAPVWTGKGAVLLNWDRFSEALVYFERARVLDADNPEPWYFRALAEEGLGRERDAVNSLRKFLDLAPRKPKLEQAMIDDAHRRLQKLRVRDTGP